MKRVIVTGGAGFIGSNLVRYLLKKKYFVINIDKLSYSANPYNLKSLNKKYPKITVIIFSYILTFISFFFLIRKMKPNMKEKISE